MDTIRDEQQAVLVKVFSQLSGKPKGTRYQLPSIKDIAQGKSDSK